MAKGQKRSNKEAKKPKKAGAGKLKTEGASLFTQPAGTTSKPYTKKT
jgi:hypothetical protein